MKTQIAVFLAVILAGCALAWLSGFDFDKRNVAVGYPAFVVLLVGAMLAQMFAPKK